MWSWQELQDTTYTVYGNKWLCADTMWLIWQVTCKASDVTSAVLICILTLFKTPGAHDESM